ncbi:hypothetical protein PVK06_008055 [Gossypium arboreum]|uniref:DUF4094 domain-containing protein n=1 Tax=Gossypium arboreum TaxID=29729 RepID=A0ABR0QJ69_GOSAR|nr:hypothetical protein PVK06_008055 [Gossypium arboreum]
MLFTDSNRMGTDPEPKGIKRTTAVEAEKLKLISEGCNPKTKEEKHVSKRIIGEVFKTHHAIQTLDKTILNLEMELAAARAAQESLLVGSPLSTDANRANHLGREMPRRLDHVEGYLELSAKPKIYFATALALWDADFYVKVDDDVDVIETLVRHRKKHCVFIGCMKSGPVLSQKGVRCNEPEYWQFGMFYTSLLMRMFHWDHGLLDLMSSILMIRDYVVADHLIVSGRPKLAMPVLLPLIRAAVEFASMLMRLKRFISSAGEERMLCGGGGWHAW